MSKQNSQSNENSKDYLAIRVFTLVLLLLLVSAIYLVRTTKKGTFDNSLRVSSGSSGVFIAGIGRYDGEYVIGKPYAEKSFCVSQHKPNASAYGCRNLWQ